MRTWGTSSCPEIVVRVPVMRKSAIGRFLPFMTGSCRPAGCALKRPGNWGLSVREQVFTLRDRLKVIHIAVESFEDLSDFVWVSSTKNYAEGHVHVGSRPNPLRNQVETRTLHNQINCFLFQHPKSELLSNLAFQVLMLLQYLFEYFALF